MPKDQPLPKEVILHAQNDTRAIQPGRSMTEAVISHAQRDTAALTPDQPEVKERGMLARFTDKLGQAWQNLRIGDEHLKSMVKLGFHEITQALQPLPDSNIRPLEEPGVFGNEGMPHIQEREHHVEPSREKDRSRSR